MTDELQLLRRRYEREGLHENAAAVEATLRKLAVHPRRWSTVMHPDPVAQFRLMPRR
jgi:hypothetical protein